jgi:mannose-1-phosphate guanylyltransferase
MGIKPTYPETGYGYIQLNKKVVHNKSYKVYTVKKFIEKPELNKAQKFIKQSDYFWNPSWPAWRVDHLMSLYKKFLPKNYSILNKVSKAPETTLQKIINTEFPKLDSVAIDYGILEKAKDLLVMPTDIGWTDIGHWRSVAEMSKTDKDGNTVVGTSVLLDSSNNFLMSNSKKMIAAVGVKDLIMVETSDVVLLIEKSRAQEVKSIVQELRKKKKMKKYL